MGAVLVAVDDPFDGGFTVDLVVVGFFGNTNKGEVVVANDGAAVDGAWTGGEESHLGNPFIHS